jgi:type II secretory pathway pseudopilin PulG
MQASLADVKLKKGRDKEMRIGLLLVAGLALIGFLVVAVVLPQMAGAEARDAAQALLAGAEPAKQQISAAAEKSGRLAGAGQGLKIAPKTDSKHGELKWIIADDGSIRGWNEKNALEVALTPSLQGGKVSWNCKGYPVNAMPASCGGR